MERHSSRIVSGESPETMQTLCLSIKFSHEEIRWNRGIFRSANQKCVYICVKEKFKFFVNYNKWSRQSINFHYGVLKILKMLWFPALWQWSIPGLFIFTLSGSCIGNLVSHEGDRRPKKFSRIIPETIYRHWYYYFIVCKY